MKNRRLRRYLEQKATRKNDAMNSKQDIQSSSDQRIDQDFPGYPHATNGDALIQPKTSEEKKTAAVGTKDGEKMLNPPSRRDNGTSRDQQDSDGSGGAFEGTETVTDDENK